MGGRKVFVVGVGMTKFEKPGKREWDYPDMALESGTNALKDAGIPFVNAESSQPALTQRGLKYFFRTSPTDETFTKMMFDFLKDFAAKSGQKFQTASIFHEDTAFGTDSAKVQERLAKENSVRILEKITYKAQTTSLSSEVQRLKAANADVLFPSSYTSDAFLLLRTAKELDYNPKMILAQNAGFTDPSFLTTMGKDAEGAITRSPYNSDLEGRIPLLAKVNEMFKKHSNGRDLSDNSARSFTGFMVLADALNRMLQESFHDFPSLGRRLIDVRNRNWIPKIEGYLRSGKTYFVVVGAGHMGGPNGLLAMLRARGYKIEQL